MGFKIEDDLNTERSRKLWLEWKQRTDPRHYLKPGERADAGDTGTSENWQRHASLGHKVGL